MKVRLPVYAGIFGGVAFSAGWLAAPSPTAVVAFSLVTSTTAALGQIGTRELLARCQAQVERGIDTFFADGGENFVEARILRDRVERLSWDPIIAGVMASAAAALGTSYSHLAWPALAFALAAVALTVAFRLFILNRMLTRWLEGQKLNTLRDQRIKDFVAGTKPLDITNLSKDPNIMGYGVAGAAIEKHE